MAGDGTVALHFCEWAFREEEWADREGDNFGDFSLPKASRATRGLEIVFNYRVGLTTTRPDGDYAAETRQSPRISRHLAVSQEVVEGAKSKQPCKFVGERWRVNRRQGG